MLIPAKTNKHLTTSKHLGPRPNHVDHQLHSYHQPPTLTPSAEWNLDVSLKAKLQETAKWVPPMK